MKWHNGSAPHPAHWTEGDVISAAADLASGDLRFAVNGDWTAPEALAFERIDVPAGGLVPALTGGQGFACSVNLGSEPFAHEPPDPSFRAVAEFSS